MFTVDAANYKISLSRGDTGSFRILLPGYEFSANDRALFTVKNGSGTEIIKRLYPIEDGAIEVELANADTDYLTPGSYSWDVRCIVNPVYDAEGNVTDGTVVRTPKLPMVMEILTTVGQI